MEEFLRVWNQEPKPFVWTATVASITEKLSRCQRTLEQIQRGSSSPRSKKGKKWLPIYFLDTTLASGQGYGMMNVIGPRFVSTISGAQRPAT